MTRRRTTLGRGGVGWCWCWWMLLACLRGWLSGGQQSSRSIFAVRVASAFLVVGGTNSVEHQIQRPSVRILRGSSSSNNNNNININNDDDDFSSSDSSSTLPPQRINGEGSDPSETTTTQQQSSRPQTGWNHKLPSGTSDFWRGPRDEQSTLFRSTAASNTELRTGWLHNSKPVQDQSKTSTATSAATGSSSNKSSGSATTSMARRRLEMARLQQERNHRVIHPPVLHPCGNDQVVAVTEHLVSVPVYRTTDQNDIPNKRSQPQKRLDVYFTVVEKMDTEKTNLFFQNKLGSLSVSPSQRAVKYVEHAAMSNADSMVLFLQGGPGFGAPVPGVGLSLSKGSGSWADAALFTHGYQRIVLMDQRGTGKSTPVTKQTLEQQFPDLFLLDTKNGLEGNNRLLDDSSDWSQPEKEPVQLAVEEVTDYLAQFRADNIVQDAEFIREALLYQTLEDIDTDSDTVGSPEDPAKPWGCSLGQSYGGFCHMTYLSQVAHPPKIMLFTGGIAPMLSNVHDVYCDLWDCVRERNLRFYAMYPGDVDVVKRIVRRLLQQPVDLPSGGRLTARRFLSLGISLGGSPSSFSSLHDLLANAFVDESDFSRAFLKQVDSLQPFDDHPIYFWLHESIYADGPTQSPTNWAANRAYQSKLESRSEFDYRQTCQSESKDEPTLFFGEHVFPWMSDDFAELNGVGLQAVANALAAKADWRPLFDGNRIKGVLEDGRTRAAAAVYHEDMYVEFNACMKVVARDGPLGKCKVYVTNEFQHSGLRDSGAALFSKLHGMAKGGTRTPS